MAKNKNKKNKNQDLVTGGLYEGDLGADAAKNDPLGFYNLALANEGRTIGNTSGWGWNFLQNQGFQNIWNRYNSALAENQDLPFLDYMSNAYGASRTPTASNPYAGSSTLGQVTVTQEYGNPDGANKRRRRRRRR